MPVLHVLILRAWRGVFGLGELPAKLLGALFGIGGVAGVFLATRVRFGEVSAWFAGAFLALNPMHLEMSREIRGYALLIMAIAFADWGFAKWCRTARIRDAVVWGACLWLAVNAHHFAWYFWAVYLVTGWLEGHSRRVVLAVGASVLIGSLPSLYSVVLFLMIERAALGWIREPRLVDLARTYSLIAGGWVTVPLVWGLVYCGGRLRAVENRIFRKAAPLPDGVSLNASALMLLLPLLVLGISWALGPLYVQRYFGICMVPLAVLFGAGTARLRRPLVTGVAGVLLAALLGSQLGSFYDAEHNDWERDVEILADEVRDGYRPGDVVLYTSKFSFAPAIAFHPEEWEEYLYPIDKADGASLILDNCLKRKVHPPTDWSRYHRVWAVLVNDQQQEWLEARPWLAARNPQLLQTRQTPSFHLVLYALRGD